jgi:hypothetical protein
LYGKERPLRFDRSKVAHTMHGGNPSNIASSQKSEVFIEEDSDPNY